MRRSLLVAALVLAAAGSIGSGTASAYCDPKYWPLCTNDCEMRPPNLRDPLGDLVRACPQ